MLLPNVVFATKKLTNVLRPASQRLGHWEVRCADACAPPPPRLIPVAPHRFGRGAHRVRPRTSSQERILRQYRTLKGKSPELSRLLYLQIVRQWPVYGSTFFLSSPDPPPNGQSGPPGCNGAVHAHESTLTPPPISPPRPSQARFRTTGPSGYFERRTETWLVGVNADGIQFVDPSKSVRSPRPGRCGGRGGRLNPIKGLGRS